MTRKPQIEGRIEAAMHSLDQLVPSAPAPFFYTRLSARMAREETSLWGRISHTISRPLVATLSVMLIVAINIVTVMHHRSSSSGMPDQAEIAVADEYNRTASLYNIDNFQP